MTRTYNPAGFATIRPGQPNEATEIDLGNGRGIQMPGSGKHVEDELRRLREARDAR